MFPFESEIRRCSALHDYPTAFRRSVYPFSRCLRVETERIRGGKAGGRNKTRIGEVRGRQINLRFFPGRVPRCMRAFARAAPPPPPRIPIQPSSFFFWPRRRLPAHVQNTHACPSSVGKYIRPSPSYGTLASTSHVSGFIERGPCHYFRDYRRWGTANFSPARTSFFDAAFTGEKCEVRIEREKRRRRRRSGWLKGYGEISNPSRGS